MEPKETVAVLVEHFHRNLAAYRSQGYNETQVRQEFINPFFEALGWDVANRAGYAEPYKDVIHEDAIKIGGATKAPDYCFRIGGTRKFFLEAKKPSVDVKADIAPAYQLRRYGWSAKLPLSILTDFEEFAVYDCRQRPKPTDGVATGRILYLTCGEYLDRFSEIYDVFARESVLRGSFDKFAESATGKRGTQEVDAAFLAEIEGWREALARNLALRNPSLSVRDLNFSVQVTIDRIIFLRMCEDRGIEPYAQLQGLLNGGSVYPRLVDILHQADDKYNSGLFDFKADALTPSLAIDDKVLKDLFARLYYPESPYEFSVLGADILGNVYEQFLGKVIRLTTGHQARVEEKPEVKKAGGVYYTPTYICDYIVKQTVGKLVEGKSPKQVSKLRILDPACGSGSFLLAAYQYLLDWHRDWYVAHGPEKHTEEIYPCSRELIRQKGGDSIRDYKLTTREKKRILLNNLYGVDIDSQAVEVTKLSLLLKVLEGENKDTLESQLSLWRERALPDLGNNIKCGNSLIGPDFYSQQTLALDEEEVYRINAFDWEREFPEVFGTPTPTLPRSQAHRGGSPSPAGAGERSLPCEAGEGRGGGKCGFDAVIGNPPYIRIQTMKEWAPREVEFYKQRYRAASKGNYDIYVVFVERGLQLLNSKGRLGFILPNKFFQTDYGEALRKLITERKALHGVVHFGHAQVFVGPTTYTCLLFLTGDACDHVTYVGVAEPKQVSAADPQARTIDACVFSASQWSFSDSASAALQQRTRRTGIPLLDLPAQMSRGSSTGADEVFVLRVTPDGYMSREGTSVEIEDEVLRTPLYATDFGRYRFSPQANERVIFPYRVTAHSYSLIPHEELSEQYPKAYGYLSQRRRRLESRKQTGAWWGYSAPRNLALHDHAQLLVPLLADKGLFCEFGGERHRYCMMASGGFSISLPANLGLAPRYVLGLLNSRLLYWHLRSISNIFRAGWITCTKQYVGTLPIRPIDFASPSDVAKHDRMVELVERMLDLHKRHAAAQTPHDKDLLLRQITATDGQIDRLVYELYELTEEEIGIVEGRP